MKLKTTILVGVLAVLAALSLVGSALAAPPEPGATARGKVKEVQGNSIILMTRAGERHVITDHETRFRIPGVKDPSIDDVHEGDLVAARGVEIGNGNLKANVVVVLPDRLARQHRLHGEVTAIEGTAIVVETPNGEQRLETNERTRYRIPDVEDPGLDDIHAGDRIVALAHKTDDGTLVALLVALRKTCQ